MQSVRWSANRKWYALCLSEQARGGAMTDNSEACDFIVVGAGSAGCVLANRLTASGRHRVMLLEAGPDSRHPWLRIPLGYVKLFTDRRFNWCYTTQPQPEGQGGNLHA